MNLGTFTLHWSYNKDKRMLVQIVPDMNWTPEAVARLDHVISLTFLGKGCKQWVNFKVLVAFL